MNLWPHQTAIIEAAHTQLRAGRRSLLLVLPTGAGKTYTAVSMGRASFERDNRVLWIVHRQELIRQAADALRSCDVPCGIIAPWSARSWEPVQVASIQTLLARGERPDANLLIVDEAHHVVSPEYFKLRSDYASAYVIGLTATPCRMDGVGLGMAFDALVPGPQPRELIAAGHLVPATVIAPQHATDHAADHPVDAYRKFLSGRRTIVFCASVESARTLASEFTLAGIPAACVDGEMDDDLRAREIERFKRGDLAVLTNMHVLTEGFDCRETSGIILARKVGSEPSLIQMTGRGMRCAPGKSDLIVVDLFGSCLALGILPDSDRIYSLDGKGVRSGECAEGIRQCKSCGRVFVASQWGDAGCPACGFIDKRRRDPRIVRQEMTTIQAAKMVTESGQAKVAFLRNELRRCACTIKRDGSPVKPGAALVAFKARFHHWPNEVTKQAAGWPRGGA